MEEDVKHIYFSQYGLKHHAKKPPKKSCRPQQEKLIATQKESWNELYDPENPNACIDLSNTTIERNRYFIQQVHRKIAGYKAQDLEKGLYDAVNFVDVSNVLQMITECNSTCFYCKQTVLLTYEKVRDSRQWTLERINNGVGHTAENVEIACLKCNIRRRTMFSEKYVLTKQMQKVVKEDA